MLRAMSETPARVLVVEDETAIADTVLYALRSEGYVPEHCLLGREALERLRNDPADLVVLDVGCRISMASRSAARCAVSARYR